MSTTKAKDILDDTTSVPTTAPDKENEVRDVDENISIQVEDHTLDNNEVRDDDYIKGSINSFKDSNTV